MVLGIPPHSRSYFPLSRSLIFDLDTFTVHSFNSYPIVLRTSTVFERSRTRFTCVSTTIARAPCYTVGPKRHRGTREGTERDTRGHTGDPRDTGAVGPGGHSGGIGAGRKARRIQQCAGCSTIIWGFSYRHPQKIK
jgi:hypothetical protein